MSVPDAETDLAWTWIPPMTSRPGSSAWFHGKTVRRQQQ